MPPSGKRRVHIDLTDPAYDPVWRFVELAYPGMPVSAGLRELLMIAAGIDPLDAATHEARKAARHEVLTAIRKRLITNMHSIIDEIQHDTAKDAAMKAAINDAPENPYT